MDYRLLVPLLRRMRSLFLVYDLTWESIDQHVEEHFDKIVNMTLRHENMFLESK